MQVLGLGKINVPSAGTPVAFSAVSLKVNQFIVSFDPADTTATIYVVDSAGNKLVAMVSTSNQLVISADGNSNAIDLSKIFADASTNNKGPMVGYTIK